MILQLTDLFTTIPLSGDGATILGCTYFPRTPDDEAQRYDRVNYEGQSVGDVRLHNVVESAEVIVEGTPAAIRQQVRAIQRLIHAARLKLRPLYVEYDPVGGVWQAEIHNGRVVWPDNPGKRRLADDIDTVSVTVIWERDPIWLSPYRELAISTAFQPADLFGRTVHNHHDSGQSNWVEVAASEIANEGDLPVPVELRLTNTTGSAIFYRNFYFGVYAYPAGETPIPHIVEGEAAQPGFGTIVNLSSCSNGQFLRKTFTGTSFIVWTLPAATVRAGAGKRFKLLMRAPGIVGTFYVQPTLRDADGLTTLWAGDEVQLTGSSHKLVDLGRAMPLPPGGPGAWGAMSLVLRVRSSASATIDVDYIQLTPTDSYRHLIQRATDTAAGATVVDDSIRNLAYWQDDLANRYDVYAVDEAPLKIMPGFNNRIYILQDRSDGSSFIEDSFLVRVYYRAGRLAV